MEFLEEKIYDKYNPLTIYRVRDKLLVKFYQMNKQSGPITSREYLEYLYVKFWYKVTCTTCKRYGHKLKEFWNKEGINVPKFNYCHKPGHVNKYWWRIIREERLNSNKNEDNKKKFNYSKEKNYEEKYF